MDRIRELWRAGTAPAQDGVYRVGGGAHAVEVGGAELPWFDVGPPLDLKDVLADPDDVMEVDICAEVELPNGWLVCGEGAHGSEGFFARLDGMRDLVWIVALRNSNPFYSVTVNGPMATFTNNLGNAATVNLDEPEFGLV
jgi:hypothetical protein